jgi:Rad3-related DNA helicase
VDPSENISRRLLMGDSAVFFSATLSPVEYYKTLLGGENQSVAETLESPFEAENLLVAVMDKIGTRYLQREETVRQIADVILTAYQKRQGNYLVFCPSFAYMEKIATAFHAVAPEIPMRVQHRDMSRAERAAFLDGFTEDARTVAFSVMGGIYSEGIDLVGERLIGAIVVGVGMPRPDPERETLRAYFEDTAECGMEFAYIYPGMNRVLQAAGRVIRSEEDRGTVILIDDRFAEPNYRRLFPKHWHGLRFVGNLHSLEVLLSRFWKSE